MIYLELPKRDRLQELFEYIPQTGELIRRTTIKAHARRGDVIKQKDAKGYLKVRVDGTRYSVHRMIYKIYHGVEDTQKQIDHINGVRDDNRIGNLRLVGQSENQKNSFLRRDNKTGVVGVFKTKFDTWTAYIQSDKKHIHLGAFKTKEEAVRERKKAEKMLSFSKRHGEEKT